MQNDERKHTLNKWIGLSKKFIPEKFKRFDKENERKIVKAIKVWVKAREKFYAAFIEFNNLTDRDRVCPFHEWAFDLNTQRAMMELGCGFYGSPCNHPFNKDTGRCSNCNPELCPLPDKNKYKGEVKNISNQNDEEESTAQLLIRATELAMKRIEEINKTAPHYDYIKNYPALNLLRRAIEKAKEETL